MIWPNMMNLHRGYGILIRKHRVRTTPIIISCPSHLPFKVIMSPIFKAFIIDLFEVIVKLSRAQFIPFVYLTFASQH